MTQVVLNDISAIVPEIWSSMVQIPLYKSLVAMEVANTRLEDKLARFDTIHMPYFGDLSAKTYTPGTTLSATNLDWKFDSLIVSTYKHATFYIDDVESLQANVEQIRPLAEEAAYQLGNAIDTHVFKNVTGTDGFTSFGVDAALLGGTAHRPISAGSANIIDLFTVARQTLRDNNVEEFGDWVAVVTPKIARFIEQKSANSGFQIADATLRNGYAGDFVGFKVYVSKNLPSGKCSAISPTISGNAVSATSCKSIYFGRSGTIDLVMQKSPTLTVKDVSDRLGKNFITWTVYGSAVFTKNRSRGLNCAIQNSYY